MTTAILTTASTFASGAIIKPATVTPPAGALLHLLPRGNELSWVNNGSSGITPDIPADIEYQPDAVLVGKTRRVNTGANASDALPRLISIVAELDPTNGLTVPLLGGVNSSAEQNLRQMSYFPTVSGGIIQVGIRVESAAAAESYVTFNIPYASTTKGWANICLLLGSDRIYGFTRQQNGTTTSGATIAGLGLRTPTDNDLFVGGNQELSHVTPWKLGELTTFAQSFVSGSATYEAVLNATKARLAPVGITLP